MYHVLAVKNLPQFFLVLPLKLVIPEIKKIVSEDSKLYSKTCVTIEKFLTGGFFRRLADLNGN